MKVIDSAKLNQRITILRKVAAQDGTYGTEQTTWVPLGDVYAEVQDVLPSRQQAGRMLEDIAIANRPARVRMRWRADVTSDMRIQIGTRVLQIIAGPAELGWREGIELMVEEVSTLGNAA